MTIKQRMSAWVLTLSTVAVVGSCTEPVNYFLEAAKEVTPVVAGGSSTRALTSSLSQALVQPGVLKSALWTLGDPATVQSHINLYGLLEETGETYLQSQQTCASMEEMPVEPPYDLGLPTETYDCGIDGSKIDDPDADSSAIRTDGSVQHALLTQHVVVGPGNQGYRVMQGIYDEASGDLTLRMVSLARDENAGDGYAMRIHVDGNDQTHQFTLNLVITDIGGGGFWTRLVGHGMSRGAGNFFLLKGLTNGGDAAMGYFCVPADVNEAKLEEIEALLGANGSTAIEPDCASYQSAVDAIEMLDTSDTPENFADFRDSSVDLHF